MYIFIRAILQSIKRGIYNFNFKRNKDKCRWHIIGDVIESWHKIKYHTNKKLSVVLLIRYFNYIMKLNPRKNM